MLANFQTANTAFGIDHTAFSLVPNQGFHKKVSLPVGAAPGSALTQAVIYSKTVGASSQLFLQRDTVATEIPLTMSTFDETGNDNKAGVYYYWLTPWGWRVFMGTTAVITSEGCTLSGVAAFGATIYTSVASPTKDTLILSAYIRPTVSTKNFAIGTNSATASNIRWLVITN